MLQFSAITINNEYTVLCIYLPSVRNRHDQERLQSPEYVVCDLDFIGRSASFKYEE